MTPASSGGGVRLLPGQVRPRRLHLTDRAYAWLFVAALVLVAGLAGAAH
jgi:hypothetical protein